MQCFVVNSEEIKEKRIDPYYYNSEFQSVIKKLFLNKKVCKVGDLILSWSRGDGPREGFYTDDKENGVFFLRVNNLKNHTIDLKDVKYINRNIHETKLKRAKVKGGDLVFAISGTKDNLGTVSIVPENIKEANLNSALVRIDLDKTKITNEYFCLFFDSQIARSQIDFIGNGAAQNNLNNEEISQILIPVPPIKIQEQIIAIIDKAHNSKKAMEEEAKKLLGGIDDYVLNELGIKIPKIEEKKCFTAMFDETIGKRLDPYYHKKDFKTLYVDIKNLANATKLNNFVEKIFSGKRPQGGVGNIQNGIPSVGGEHILDNGFIEEKNLKYIPVDFHQNNLNSKLKINDVVIIKDGATTGKIGILQENYPFKEININEHIFALRAKANVNPFYLFLMLKSTIGQKQIKQEITGATVTGIIQSSIQNILLPLPPIETQNKIASEAKYRMQKATQLKEEAKLILQKAKHEVEKMILGGD